jgi:hypothetical protein
LSYVFRASINLFILLLGVVIMSHDENFSDESNFFHLIIAILVLIGMPLLPMLMGWYNILA